MMRIMSEDEILKQDVRLKLIEQFESDENQRRKAQAFKAYECLKDKTINYVYESISRQFDADTVYEMTPHITNISIFKKVINKLAKVYSNGVIRSMGEDQQGTKQVEEAAKYLDMTTAMKKCNKYYRAFLNTLVFVKPLHNEGLYDIAIEVKPPFHYDAVEDALNPHKALAIVLSDYDATRPTVFSIIDAAFANRGSNDSNIRQVFSRIYSFFKPAIFNAADSKKEYIWWSKSYHFTTNARGEVISDGPGTNPILTIPFVNFTGEQDGCFWAEGGYDLVDTGIQINTQISNLNHIGLAQGHGQLYMTGEGLPKSVKVGPNVAVQLEHTKDQPDPTIGYLNANPQLGELRSNAEMSVALMLSTNNLSTSGFSVSMQGGKDFASGIALMIDKSESIEDIGEQSQIFVKAEPEVFDLARKWQDAYKASKSLTEGAQMMEIPKDVKKNLQVKFPSPKPIMSESELLDVYKKRLDMKLNTRVDIIMRDDPSLSLESAIKKIAEIDEEKAAAMVAVTGGFNGETRDQDSSEGSSREFGGDQLDDQPNGGAGSASEGEEED